MRVRAFVVVLAAGSVLAAGGCSAAQVAGNPSTSSDDFGSTADMIAEYRAAETSLTLPPGVSWPAQVPTPSPAPDLQGHYKPPQFEKGYGTSIAQTFWWCSWEGEWLAQRAHDTTRASTALTKLNSVKTLFMYTQGTDDGGREHYDSLLRAAGLDDPTLLAADHGANC